MEILKYFAQGGVQRDLRFTAEALARRGAEIVILAERAEAAAPAGCSLVTLPVRGLSNHARARNFAAAAKKYLQTHPADAVIGFNRLPDLDLYFAADDALQTRWCNPLLNRFSARRRTFLALEKSVFAPGGAAEIFTLTARQERDYAAYYGTAPERYFRLGPGVDAAFQRMERTPEARSAARARFGALPEQLMIVQAAASFHTKGVDRLLDILAALPDSLRKRVTAVVAGGGKAVPQYRELAARRDLPVRFIGSTDDMPGLLMGADLMLHAARAEATGGVIAEALVSGVPVMTTELCGYAELVTQHSGGVVLPEPFDLHGWSHALQDLLVHPEKLAVFRTNLATVWQAPSWYGRNEVMAAEILRFAAQKGGAQR